MESAQHDRTEGAAVSRDPADPGLSSAAAQCSAVVLARDAQATLVSCLESLRDWVPILVVVDERSRDGTHDIATTFGCRVETLGWRGGFGEQRNAALGLSETDWVFFVDADEEVTPGLRREIDDLFQRGPRFPAYSVPRRNNLLGHWMRAGGWWPDRQVRLINRLSVRFNGAVHETIDCPLTSIGRLKGRLLHRTHVDAASVVDRADGYSRLEAEEALASGRPRPGKLAYLLSPPLHWLSRYVLKAGIIDGRAGWQEARLQTLYQHLRLIRRREGPDAQPAAFYRRLIPRVAIPATAVSQDATVEGGSRPPDLVRVSVLRDPLAVGLLVLLMFLPFHLAIKPLLPGPLGEGWKEGLIAILAVLAMFRLSRAFAPIYSGSWVARFGLAYAVLVLLTATAVGMHASALQGVHIDLVYVPLALVALALTWESLLSVVVISTLSVGVICTAGALFEVLAKTALFPSQTLQQQYGRPEVYVNGTHLLRPYFTFDFPTGLGAYLAVATVLGLAGFATSRRLLYLAAAGFCAVGMTLTFSRGPWVGAVVGILSILLVARDRSRWLRVTLGGGAIALLTASGVVAAMRQPPAPPVRVLVSSPQLRTVTGHPKEHPLLSILRQGDLVIRKGLPPPSGPSKATEWKIGGTRVAILGEPAPARGSAVLGYRVVVPDSAVLAWGVALNPKIWQPDKGDGVRFRIDVVDGGPVDHIFSRYIDPKNNLSDRRLFRFRFPLYGYSGESLLVRFMTDAGPRGDADYDWAGWVNPRLVRLPRGLTSSAYHAVGSSVESAPATNSLYFASIGNWNGDQSNADRLAAWNRSLAVWRTHPILGTGPGSVDEAATRSGQSQPLITESQIGKVLVETGAAGIILWFGLLGLSLWMAYRRFQATSSPAALMALAGLLCISVTGAAFQVLEVKQIAAIFWVLIGLAIVSELALKGFEPQLRPWPAVAWPLPRGVSWHWPRGRTGPAIEAVSSFREAPAPAPLQPVLPNASDSVLPIAPDIRPLRVSEAKMIPTPTARAAGGTSIKEVVETHVAQEPTEVNGLLERGWRLLAVGVTTDGPSFVLGRWEGMGRASPETGE